jgi:hypothetical protein
MGPECQSSKGTARGEKEIGQHKDEDGPPLANRPSSIMPESTRRFLGRTRLFAGRLRVARDYYFALNQELNVAQQ